MPFKVTRSKKPKRAILVRVNHFTSALLLFFLTAPAHAGVPIALPTTEELTMWEDAFEIAGLEAAHGSPSITIKVQGSWWEVRVTAPGGRLRTARIPTPVSAADREDTALLAIGLARELGLAKAPQQRSFATPPPPPPPSPPVHSPPVPPDPIPPSQNPTEAPPIQEASPFIVQQLPHFTIDSSDPVPPPIYPKRRSEWTATSVSTSPPLELKPRRRRFGQISSPGLHMGVNTSLREQAELTLGFLLGSRIFQFQQFFGGIDILVDVGRILHLGAVQERVIQTNRLQANVGIDWLQRAHLIGHFGITYLAFSQQDSPIDQWYTPHLGVSAELDLVKFRDFTIVGLRATGLAELGVIQLRDEFNKTHPLSPLEANISFLFKIPPLGDPSIPMATPTP